MGRTRLSPWLLQRQALVLVLASTLVLWVCHAVVSRGFDSIERDRVVELLERSAGMLRSDARAMLSSARDYANWDDTYRFMTAGNPGFIDANFAPEAMANLGVDWVAFIAADRRLVHGRYTGEQHAGRPLAPEVSAALLATLPARAEPTDDAGGSSLVWVRGKPMLVAWAAIGNSAHTAQAGSWLAFGRDLSIPSAGRADWRLGLPFAIHPLASDPGAPHRVRREGSDWVGGKALSPWPAALGLRERPAYERQRTAVLTWLSGGIVVLTVLAMAGLALLLRVKVLRRLEQFARLAELSSDRAGAATRWPVSGSDELDALAQALNGLMERSEQQESELAYLASHDPLTGVGNRRQLMAGLRAAIDARAGSPDAGACLLVLDLDQFKSINDSLGHAAGDAVLSVVAERILLTIRPGDQVARLGGDEFAVLLNGIRVDEIPLLCERLLARLAHAMPYQDRLLFSTASIGIAWVEPGLSEHDILLRADHAMYLAKQAGRNRTEYFEPLRED